MPELTQLYSPQFEKQLQTLDKGFDKLVIDLNNSAKGLKKVDESLRQVEKTRSDINKNNNLKKYYKSKKR